MPWLAMGTYTQGWAQKLDLGHKCTLLLQQVVSQGGFLLKP